MSHWEYVELHCTNCTWREMCGLAEMQLHLARIGMLKRAKQPEPELVAELFHSSLARLACPQCESQVAVADVEDDADAWGDARACEGCGQGIPRARLEALPRATLCVACAEGRQRGEVAGEEDYCPRCGTPMQLAKSQQGITRYELVCPRCGR